VQTMTNNATDVSGGARQSADITGLAQAMRRRWRVIAGSLLMCLAVAAFLLFILPARYTATTQILLDPHKTNVLQNQAVMQGVPLDASAVESEVSLIQSFNIGRRVVEKLALDKDTEFVSRGGGLVSRLLGMVGFDSKPVEVTTDATTTAEMALAIAALKSNMTVRRVGITLVIEVGVTSKDRMKAAKIANAVTDAYLIDQLEARYDAAKRASGWLSDRLGGLRDTLQASERKVAEYRAEFGLVDTGAAGGGIDKQQVAEINGQIALARAAAAEKQAKYEQTQRLLKGGSNMQSVAEVLQSSVVSNLRTQEAEVARKEADLATRYGDRHPLVVNVRAELTDVRRAISSEVQRIVSNVKNEYEVAQKREQSLQDSLQKLTGVATSGDETRIKLRELEREAETNRTLYQSFLSRFKETREQTTLETSESRVITPASIPTIPSFPRQSVVLGLASFLGLMFGVGGVLLLEYIENGFMTVEQTEATLGYPVLAILPNIEKSEYDPEGTGVTIPTYVVKKPLSRFSEAIRAVRVGVSLSNVDAPPKLVLITSSVPGEGKSTFSSAFATSAAATGQRVLLIDGDMRHPSTSKLFGLEKQIGLVDLLGTGLEPVQVIQRFHGSTLSVLPAGGATKNAPDLLGSQKMMDLLKQFRSEYDFIVVDTPPVTAVVDSLIVANEADKIVFVIEWESTPREVVARAMSVLGTNKERLAGIVLNKAQLKQMRYHQTYYGYYSSSYNKRYDKYYEE
jgi:polysaccharide biosynthesis transport protein